MRMLRIFSVYSLPYKRHWKTFSKSRSDNSSHEISQVDNKKWGSFWKQKFNKFDEFSSFECIFMPTKLCREIRASKKRRNAIPLEKWKLSTTDALFSGAGNNSKEKHRKENKSIKLIKNQKSEFQTDHTWLKIREPIQNKKQSLKTRIYIFWFIGKNI